MKFGTWLYTGYYVDLKHFPQGSPLNSLALHFYKSSNEWWRQLWVRCWNNENSHGSQFLLSVITFHYSHYVLCH
ncbi:unnamed protein product [Onchocerca flexuosa]|uniref:Ovule protein n=1 Tax=Onchocerca flexuosa TaxID=387005 RepID=A0A183H6A3_9BILA|nr:unnamed protein product [Onchocerca flexuosa]